MVVTYFVTVGRRQSVDYRYVELIQEEQDYYLLALSVKIQRLTPAVLCQSQTEL